MPFLDFLFRRSSAAQRAEADRVQTTVSNTTRRDLLRLVVRDALFRNGIPPTWVVPEVVRAVHRDHERGLHLRMVLKHWDPRLLLHAVALEQDMFGRLQLLDPTAGIWFAGISWQFGLPDASRCPPLPHPGSWTAAPPDPAPPTQQPEARQGADVIAGPVVIQAQAADARADLERLLATRDEDMRRQARDGDAFARTQPVQL
ncbi:hypothetical protein HHL11_32080 [Ramlibacter sp. G-1-2-2]|uniref:Uncharacterized protein n=1 Tax=Ramlibacter agri TaxID=2728837 RepID=A0A848HG74_9BURK|nr:hypothetical protein [Ramlibacter agri]NML48429.1 hypothetical protein [Ramlibacter agri]